MEHLLFVAYLVLFAWLVTRTRFFTRSGLSHSQLVILFLLKVMAGIFYGWMGKYYGDLAQMVDTWSFHQAGREEYKLLLTDPGAYISNLFYNPYPGGLDNFFGSYNSYWNDLKGNIFVKLLSVFNIFSFGQYYINVIFFSFISLFGPMAVYRVMNDIFPGQKMTILLASFLIPSFIYWTSGIHKEGLIFLAISLIIYHLYFGYKDGRYHWKRWIAVIVSLLLLLLLRNFMMALVIPAVIAWLLAARRQRHGLGIFLAVYAFCAILFFNGRHISERFDFPKAVVDKQQAFLQLQGGGSNIPIKKLEPDAVSFLKNVPQAVTLSLLRPYPGDVRDLLTLAACVEINLLLALFVLFLVFRRKNQGHSGNIIYLFIFFSLSVMLAIGFSVNNLGAIVRYRSIIFPLLLVPMVALTDWKKIIAFLGQKNNRQPLSNDQLS
ncbi:MAG: hypothetical protein JNK14_14620 [Chitinophagaceae bacterium]|nr:hypothetical protein [Chitinophagaceae bacterium]